MGEREEIGYQLVNYDLCWRRDEILLNSEFGWYLNYRTFYSCMAGYIYCSFLAYSITVFILFFFYTLGLTTT